MRRKCLKACFKCANSRFSNPHVIPYQIPKISVVFLRLYIYWYSANRYKTCTYTIFIMYSICKKCELYRLEYFSVRNSNGHVLLPRICNCPSNWPRLVTCRDSLDSGCRDVYENIITWRIGHFTAPIKGFVA